MNIANKISLFRLLSVPFFIACLYYSSERPFLRIYALAIFLLAVLSDAVDGYIARKTKQKSQAGLVLDPLADKILLLSAFVLLYILHDIPFWALLIVITRDVLILLGCVVIYLIKQNINIYPSQWGKLTTTSQMSFVLSSLLNFRFSYVVLWIAVLCTVVSGALYVRKGFFILYGQNGGAKK
ncbi:MAG: CDP-diacylglycerol--glycerol-3-phosphate 3-phosphatidyltransferase [Candidatus Omnitrophica bacterium]|nr:CDP-diacylglycerol--glycerol-3-phosphate 3-phosphatidyltransferase [Candidatus Omnitrophota bacterium]